MDRLGIWATERRKWVVGCWIGDGPVVLTSPPQEIRGWGLKHAPNLYQFGGPNLKTCVGELNPVLNPLGPKLVGT